MSTLPKHLAISFPIWCIHDTQPAGAYHDLEQVVTESAERGFNCLRVDDGAGLIDFSCNPPNGVVTLQEPYPGFTRNIRQSWCVGDGGPCNLLERLIQLCEAAKRHEVYLILSSWYYLHTYWYHADNALNERLHAIPPHERHQYFAEQLDHLLQELRSRDLLSTIAFCEILNEADGLKFVGNYGNSLHASEEERKQFGKDHADAIAWLRQRHPDVLFAYDTYTPDTDPNLFPCNLQVWNFHSYYMWGIYSMLEGKLLNSNTDVTDPAMLAPAAPYLVEHPTSLEQVYASREGRMFAAEDWYRRIWLYSNLDRAKLPSLEEKFMKKFSDDMELYKQRLVNALDTAVKFRDTHCPGVPLVLGESCTYIGSNFLQWEEHCDLYWEFLEFAVKQFRSHGLWGAALRTCSGREDPSWTLRPKEWKYLNNLLTE